MSLVSFIAVHIFECVVGMCNDIDSLCNGLFRYSLEGLLSN